MFTILVMWLCWRQAKFTGEGLMAARLAVDIGGTFTDIALSASNRTYIAKVLTTHGAPERGFLDGMSKVLTEAGVSAADLELVVHGTTLATNAIIERRGAKTALLTTNGFRDVIEIADEGRYDQYDLKISKPIPLVPRALRYTVAGRMDASGIEIEKLDEAGVRRTAIAMREAAVEAVAIGFIHAYRNPDHENRARAIIEAELPGIPVSISSEVCPEIREFERLSTTCANAYVRPIMDGYLERLDASLAKQGSNCPLLLMTSGGGLASVEMARRLPIRLVESGPAGGAILASEIASSLGLKRAVSFDMGGTTAKICLIEDGKPESARTFEVARAARFRKGSGLPLRIPVIEMIEIGAGGGSIAHIDRLGGISVGPQSAESEPGPACYSRGGTEPTVTDADLVLGRIAADGFAGGTMTLSLEASKAALERRIGKTMKLTPMHAAFGVCETIDETMTNAARVYSVERGKDLSDHVMIAFGGAAPLHAARMAEKLRVPTVVIPKNAGVGSALGFMCAPIAYETVRSHYMLMSAFDGATLDRVFQQLREEADAALTGIPGIDLSRCREERHVYMRYLGQGHEILVPLRKTEFSGNDQQRITELFADRYARLFKRTLPDTDIELLTLGIRIEAANALRLSDVNAATEEHFAIAASRRKVFSPDCDDYVDAPVVPRGDMRRDQPIPGPCMIAEETTTIYVSSAFSASVDTAGNIILSRNQD